MPRTTSSSAIFRRNLLPVFITFLILTLMFIEIMRRNGSYRRTLQAHCNLLLAQGNTRGYSEVCASLPIVISEFKPPQAGASGDVSLMHTFVAPVINAAIDITNGIGLLAYTLNGVAYNRAETQPLHAEEPTVHRAGIIRNTATQAPENIVMDGASMEEGVTENIATRNAEIGNGSSRLANPSILGDSVVFEDDIAHKLFLAICSSSACTSNNVTDVLGGTSYYFPKQFNLPGNKRGIVFEGGATSDVFYMEVDISLAIPQRTLGPIRANLLPAGVQNAAAVAFNDAINSGCILWRDGGLRMASRITPGSAPAMERLAYTQLGGESSFALTGFNSVETPYLMTWSTTVGSAVYAQPLNATCQPVGPAYNVADADTATHAYPVSVMRDDGNTVTWLKGVKDISTRTFRTDGTPAPETFDLPTASLIKRGLVNYQFSELTGTLVPGTRITVLAVTVRNIADGSYSPYITAFDGNNVYIRFYPIPKTPDTTTATPVSSVTQDRVIHSAWQSTTPPTVANPRIEYTEILAGTIYDDYSISSATVVQADPTLPFIQTAPKSVLDHFDLGAADDFEFVTLAIKDLQDNPLPNFQFVSINATGDAIPATVGGVSITPPALRDIHAARYVKEPDYNLEAYKVVVTAKTVNGNPATYEKIVNIQAQDFLPVCRVPAAYINLVEGRTARIPFGDFCSYPNKNMAPSTADSPAIRITGFDGLKLPAGCRVEGTTLVCDKVTAATVKDSGLTVQINMKRVFNGTEVDSLERVTLRRVPAPSSKKNKVAAIAGGSVGALCVISTTAAVGAALFNKAKKKSNGRNFGAERDDVKARLGEELFEHYELCTFIAKELVATLKITHERLNVTKDAYNQTSPFGEVIAKVYEVVRALHNAGEIDFVNQNKRYRLLNDDKLPIERLKKIGAKLANVLIKKYPDLIKAEKQRYTKELIDNVADAFIRDIQAGWKDKTKWKKEFTFGGINTENMQRHDMVMLPPVISTSFVAPEPHFAMPSTPIDITTDHTEQYEQHSPQGSDGSPPGAGKAAAASASHGSPAGAGVFGVRQTGTAGFKPQQGGAPRDEEMGLGNNGDEPGVELQGIRLDFVNSGRRVTRA